MARLKFLASLKLAVVLLLGLVFSLAAATFIESGYDTQTAQYWVYRSWWFAGLLALLGVNILSVALSRLPWKPRHIPFLLAHLGILTLLTGSFLTQKYGLDGSMRITEGDVTNAVELENAGLFVVNGDSFKRIIVPWIPPTATFKPIRLKDSGLPYDLTIDRYLTHADGTYEFIPDTAPAAKGSAPLPALKVKLEGGAMAIQQEFWLWGGDPAWSHVQAGPARLVLDPPGAPRSAIPRGSPSLRIIPVSRPVSGPSSGGGFRYVATSSEGREVSGFMPAEKIAATETAGGYALDPKWHGGVKIVFEKWLPRAIPQASYAAARMQWGSAAPSSAIHLLSGGGGPGNELWLGLGERAVLELGGGPNAPKVELGYYPERVILPFQIKLEHFKVDHYDGTSDPSSYSSQVDVLDKNGKVPVLISMNEPLHHMGITLYQASYEDAAPRPVTSILSVNRDPGRPWKYAGSILIVLGSILLFSMKYVSQKKAARRSGKS